MSYKPVANRHETQREYNSRRVRELADQHVHDPRPVVPLSFIQTPFGDVVLLKQDTIDNRRELANMEDIHAWNYGE